MMLSEGEDASEAQQEQRESVVGSSRRGAGRMRAMILAAGLGTRLRPLTAYRAKPALPVRGRPVISLLLELLARHGVEQVLVNLHHLPATIREAVRRDHPAGIQIDWSEEPRPLGTGGGIRRAAEFLSASPECVVLAGDMLLDLDLRDLLEKHREAGRRDGREITLVLRDDPRGADFGTIGLDAEARLARIGRRPIAGSAPEVRQGLFTGVRFLSRSALRGWPQSTEPNAAFEDLRDWIAPRVEHGGLRVGAEIVGLEQSVWEPVGTPAEYLEVNLAPPSLPSIGGAASAWGGALRPIAEACGSVIDSSAEIPPDARLERCVVWDHERVPAGFHGREGVYAGHSFHPCRGFASGSPE